MNIVQKIDDNLYKQFEIFIDRENLEKETYQRLIEFGKDAEVEGFRRGKVPLAIIKLKYGKQAEAVSHDSLLKSINE